MSNDPNANQDPEGGDNLAELRAAADRGRKLERENAFLRAGIDTDSPVGKMFAKAYDGDIASLDAIKAAALEVGAIKAPEAATPPSAAVPDPLEQAQQQQQQRMRETLQQGAPSGDEPPATADPYDDALGNFNADRKKGMPRENAQVAAVDRILMAGGSGDQRVIHRPGR